MASGYKVLSLAVYAQNPVRKLSNNHMQQLVQFEKNQLCQILGGCL